MRTFVLCLTAATFLAGGTALTDRAEADVIRLKSGGEVRCTMIWKERTIVNCACASGSMSFPETMVQEIIRDGKGGYAAAPVPPSASQATVYGSGTQVCKLVAAAGGRDMGAVKKLLEDGADINGLYKNDSWKPPRIEAPPGTGPAEVLIPIPPGAHSPSSGNTPLMWAAECGNAAMVQLLLEKGANPNVRKSLDDKGRSTALYKAVQSSKNKEIVRLILSRNPDTESLETAFEVIAQGSPGSGAYLDMFLEHGIPAECRHRVLTRASERNKAILEAAYLKHSNLRK